MSSIKGMFLGGRAHWPTARRDEPPSPAPAPRPVVARADTVTAVIDPAADGNALAGLLGDVDWDVLTGGDAADLILGGSR